MEARANNQNQVESLLNRVRCFALNNAIQRESERNQNMRSAKHFINNLIRERIRELSYAHNNAIRVEMLECISTIGLYHQNDFCCRTCTENCPRLTREGHENVSIDWFMTILFNRPTEIIDIIPAEIPDVVDEEVDEA